VLAVAAVWFLMDRTPFGYELKMLGSNRKFCRIRRHQHQTRDRVQHGVSGMLAGLAGAHLAMGLLKRLTLNLSPGIGFEGIVVALLARNDPRWPCSSPGLFYGYLRTGAQIMERSSDVTREVVLIIQAIIILLVTAERLLPVLLPFLQRQRQRRAGAGAGAATGEATGATDVD
jgi:ABC-type uncharacterized transport system permease subunit